VPSPSWGRGEVLKSEKGAPCGANKTMGNRIAKIEGMDWWVVYRSASGALYEPMFSDELSAWLFARVLDFPHGPDADYALGQDVTTFVKLSYGGEDDWYETPLYVDEVASVTAGTIAIRWNRGEEILEELLAAFKVWRQDKRVAPPVRVERQEAE